MYHFSSFTTVDAVKCGRGLRGLGAGARTMTDAAEDVVRFFHDSFVEKETGIRSCVLVRLFKTHDYDGLEGDLKPVAAQAMGGMACPQSFKCLALLGTSGANPEWESRKGSKGHQVIPLPSVQVAERLPMIRNVISQMGMEINSIVNPDPRVVMDLSQRTYNVFHVPDAIGSPYIPAQEDFVRPYGVRSVLGFGGVLPSGNVFVVIIFSRTSISKETANRFTTLALNVKMVLLPFVDAVFP
jgi:hypothetical protein